MTVHLGSDEFVVTKASLHATVVHPLAANAMDMKPILPINRRHLLHPMLRLFLPLLLPGP